MTIFDRYVDKQKIMSESLSAGVICVDEFQRKPTSMLHKEFHRFIIVNGSTQMQRSSSLQVTLVDIGIVLDGEQSYIRVPSS